MIQTQLKGKKLLLVQVPANAYDMKVINKTLEGWKPTGGIFWYRDLPSTGWKLLGLCSQIPEDVAAGLVDAANKTCGGKRFDYRKRANVCNTAAESLSSFVKSKNRNPETTALLIEQ